MIEALSRRLKEKLMQWNS